MFRKKLRQKNFDVGGDHSDTSQNFLGGFENDFLASINRMMIPFSTICLLNSAALTGQFEKKNISEVLNNYKTVANFFKI